MKQSKFQQPNDAMEKAPVIVAGEPASERRRGARLDIPIKVRYKVSAKEKDHKDAVTKNISAGGCLFLTTEKLDIGSMIELDILLGDSDDESSALKIKGRILRLDREEQGLYEYGIEFGGLSPDARRLFADYCFAKMYELIGLKEWPTDRRQK